MPSDFIAAQEFAIVPHVPDRLQQLHGIKVENILAPGTVSEYLVVTGQAEDVVYIKGSGPENIALQGNSVPVAGDHLQYRLYSHEFQMDTGSQAAEAGNRGLVVRYINRIHIILEQLTLFFDDLGVAASRWAAFGGYSQMTGCQYLF